MTTEVFSGTEAIGATEHSLTTDTAGPDVQTTPGEYQLICDVSDMVAADELLLKVYDKARSGDTQRPLYTWPLSGPQSHSWVQPLPLPLMHGWEYTAQAPVGTITLLRSIRKLGVDVSSDVTAIKAVTDKVDDTLEDDAGTYRFTANALEEAPAGGGGGDATEAKQDIIIAAVADIPTNAELATALGTADDAVLAQVALVKAKTDSLTFTVAGKVDSNITHVNETEVTGDGETGSEWGPVS